MLSVWTGPTGSPVLPQEDQHGPTLVPELRSSRRSLMTKPPWAPPRSDTQQPGSRFLTAEDGGRPRRLPIYFSPVLSENSYGVRIRRLSVHVWRKLDL